MKKMIFFCCMVWGLFLATGSAETLWYEFDVGMSMAKDSGKPVIVFFESPGCYTCEDLKVTLRHEVVSEKLESFVPIHVMGYAPGKTYLFQGEEYTMRKLMKKFKVRARPALLFLTANGEKITLLRGEVGRKRLCAILDSVYEQSKMMDGNNNDILAA